MRALRGRQAALLALQQDAEAKLASTRQKSNESRSVSNELDDMAASMARRVDSLSESNAGRPTDPDLLDIRQQLQYLRNELKTQVSTIDSCFTPRNPCNYLLFLFTAFFTSKKVHKNMPFVMK